MRLDGYVACICEGAAERAIMEILLEKEKLIFDEDKLLNGEIIRCRGARQFEKTYLRKGFNEKITILRILDSRREQFNLSKYYIDKIEVVDIITAPEIEMLIIFNENKYNEFKSSRLKPSEFCKCKLGYKNVKSYDFINEYFSNVENLLRSIREYRRVSNIKKREYTLLDLIK